MREVVATALISLKTVNLTSKTKNIATGQDTELKALLKE